jgi:hypothetical protein
MTTAPKKRPRTGLYQIVEDEEGQLLIVYTGDRDPGGHRMSVLYRKKR